MPKKIPNYDLLWHMGFDDPFFFEKNLLATNYACRVLVNKARRFVLFTTDTTWWTLRDRVSSWWRHLSTTTWYRRPRLTTPQASSKYVALADPRGGSARDAFSPPRCNVFSVLFRFWEKIAKVIDWRTQPLVNFWPNKRNTVEIRTNLCPVIQILPKILNEKWLWFKTLN